MLLIGGRVWAPHISGATALGIRAGTISYVGPDGGAAAAGGAVIGLRGRLVTPAFVDAHLHAVQAGQAGDGLDLNGVPDRATLLSRLTEFAATHRERLLIFGHGWDERLWPDPRPPLRSELDRAAPGRCAYLARIDVHSAVASTALLDRVPGIAGAAGFRTDGLLTGDAHHLCRGRFNAMTEDGDRRRWARVSLEQAARKGVGAVHELGGPHLGPVEDLGRVRDAAAALGMSAELYWGELASPVAVDLVRELGLRGLAGDLCIDGAIGSHTAALEADYVDRDGRGLRYLSDEEIAEHVQACTGAGLQAGFHCIGDRAVSAAVRGLRRAAEALGASRIRAARHRLEHLEMIAAEDVATLADLGVAASVQPAFDAAWGGPGGLYQQRLGAERATAMNPFGALHRGGVRLAFGTDAPVTAITGWGMVRDATRHWRADQRLSTAAALEAATAGGHWAARRDHAGRLRRGAPASFAVWEVRGEAAADGLPTLAPGDPLPHCVATVVEGRVVFGADWLREAAIGTAE